MKTLLDNTALEGSHVVANRHMNRERQIAGVNSYAAELHLNPLAFVEDRLTRQRSAAWLDLCCGTGKALIQASRHFQRIGLKDRVTIHGVDLVRMFDPVPPEACVSLEAASTHDWHAPMAYDLITCVHGLHYVGDKLGIIARAISWLTSDGLFIGHLDLDNLRLSTGRWTAGQLIGDLKRAGLEYQRRRLLISCRGKRSIAFPFSYEGADDSAGPNATRQPAVDSYYSHQLGASSTRTKLAGWKRPSGVNDSST